MKKGVSTIPVWRCDRPALEVTEACANFKSEDYKEA